MDAHAQELGMATADHLETACYTALRGRGKLEPVDTLNTGIQLFRILHYPGKVQHIG